MDQSEAEGVAGGSLPSHSTLGHRETAVKWLFFMARPGPLQASSSRLLRVRRAASQGPILPKAPAASRLPPWGGGIGAGTLARGWPSLRTGRGARGGNGAEQSSQSFSGTLAAPEAACPDRPRPHDRPQQVPACLGSARATGCRSLGGAQGAGARAAGKLRRRRSLGGPLWPVRGGPPSSGAGRELGPAASPREEAKRRKARAHGVGEVEREPRSGGPKHGSGAGGRRCHHRRRPSLPPWA